MIRAKTQSPASIIAAMRACAPPGQLQLGRWDCVMLRELTADLIAARPDAPAEYRRFLAIGQRKLPGPQRDLGGAFVVVTGGTGCIGSALLRRLRNLHPGLLVSISRGEAARWPRWDGVHYVCADIRDDAAIDRLMREIQPDLVFHAAAQRDPGLAATGVHQTVTTNVLGTRNVLAAATAAGVPELVYASTGKALRPYSPEIYTASKKAAEYLCAETARTTGMAVSAGRFTHVLDNSIIHDRLRGWAADSDAVVRLHSPDIVFYVQSARESAQLLLSADGRRGELRIHAITDLGWPVALLDVALTVLRQAESKTPMYFSGYSQGYEEPVPDGLYDPAVSWNISPLINGTEARQLAASRCPGIDCFRYTGAGNQQAGKALAELEVVCGETQDSQKIRCALDRVSRELRDGS